MPMLSILLTLLKKLHTIIGMGLGSMVLAILTGKTLRRLLLLPFKLISRKTKTIEDDLLVREAARDLGLHDDAAPEVKEDAEKK
jgi:hypothetical protein